MSTTRLSVGDIAPPLSARSLTGTRIDVRGAKTDAQATLVSFLRYASCPMCNLRMRELVRALPSLRTRSIDVVVVLHSPVERALTFTPPELHSHTIADPTRVLYRQFGAELSWLGIVRTMLTPSFYVAFVKAMAFGYWGGMIDGTFASMPADFLVSADGRIIACRYGAHLGDHLSIDKAIGVAESSSVSDPRRHR